MIAIVDYGAGNLTSVVKAFRYLGAPAEATHDAALIRRADAVVLPGVGHFAATSAIDERGLTDAIRKAIGEGKPSLGICVGLQWMFEGSAEAPGALGLGGFRGRCERFAGSARVPHVGWNQLRIKRASQLLTGLRDGANVYFTHSYFAPLVPDTVATTEYGIEFSAAVENKNLFAVQFHPEKSGDTGLSILRNFMGLAC